MNLLQPAPGRRTVLGAFLVSIAISAAIGIGTLLISEFSSLQVKVLMTSLSVSAGTLGVLCGAALMETRRSRFPAATTMASSVLATALACLGLWLEVEGEAYWKLTAIASILAATGAQASLVGLAELAPPHRWARVAAVGGGCALALVAIVMILGEEGGEAIMRMLAATSVFAAAATLSVPILHRMGAGHGVSLHLAAPPFLQCPVCGARQQGRLDEITCTECGARFQVLDLGASAARSVSAGAAQ